MSRRRRARSDDGSPEERQARLAQDVLEFALVVGLLALLFRPLALLVGVIWAIRLVSRGVRDVYGPELRERWVERELERRRSHRPAEARRHPELRAAQSRRVSELSSRVAHELRDPVRAARTLVQQMGQDPGAEGNVVHAHAALAELDRVERSIASMLQQSRSGRAAGEAR